MSVVSICKKWTLPFQYIDVFLDQSNDQKQVPYIEDGLNKPVDLRS